MSRIETPLPDDGETGFAYWPDGGQCGALLRAIDWTRHPLGPPGQWPAVLRHTVGIILGSRQPMFVCWGPQNHTLYNDEYAAICGKRHPAALGAPLAEIWFDIWDQLVPLLERVRAGESIHMDNIEFVLHRNGYPEQANFAFSYNPMRDRGSEVQGLFCACTETTTLVRLRRELDLERARLGQVFENAPNLIVKVSGERHVIELANPAYMRLVGERDIVGKPAAEALPEIVGQGFIEILDTVLAEGKPATGYGARIALKRHPTGPLEDHYLDFVFQPVTDASGVTTDIIATANDVTDRVLAQAALAASEQFLRSIIDTSEDCIKVLTLDGEIAYFSDGGRAIMEVPAGQILAGLSWPDLWAEPERSLVQGALAQARAGAAARFQGYAATMAGNRRYWDVRVTPMCDAQGRPERILAVSRDITYLKLIEDERETLTHELSHRLKNAFGMVQSVINQTLRQATSLAEGREVLSGRIQALAAAQGILTRAVSGTMQVQAVVDAALLPHRTEDDRFEIAGPAAQISGRQGLGLSLALHELATNAIKYGALSVPGGRVAIGWTVEDDGRFSLRWEERGGPVVTPPERKGFGSVLIEKIVATYFDGSGTLTFDPTGVVFEMSGTIAAGGAHEVVDPY